VPASNAEFAWLAGLLEAEGSFLKGPPSAPRAPALRVQMTDEDVVARVAEMFCVSLQSWQRSDPDGRDRFKLSYLATKRGRGALSLMRTLRPMLGKKRRSQVDAVISAWRPRELKVNMQEAQEICLARERGVTHSLLSLSVYRGSVRSTRAVW
jgi:hypothetical protein